MNKAKKNYSQAKYIETGNGLLDTFCAVTTAKVCPATGKSRLGKFVKKQFSTALPIKEFNRFYKKLTDRFGALLKGDDKIYVWNIGQEQFEKVLSLGVAYDAKWIQGGYTAMYVGDEILLK